MAQFRLAVAFVCLLVSSYSIAQRSEFVPVTDEMLQSPKVRDLQHRVKLEEDPEATKVGWGPMNVIWNSTVEITTEDGRCFTRHVEYPKGEQENPFTPQDHIDKLANMASWLGMKQSQIDELIRTLDRLDVLDHIPSLTRLLVP